MLGYCVAYLVFLAIISKVSVLFVCVLCLVLGSDWMLVGGVSDRPVPKYDNIVNKGSANNHASIWLPQSMFLGQCQLVVFFLVLVNSLE